MKQSANYTTPITQPPLVTIGVLSYNYSKYVIAALNSLLAQTYSNIEIIIIDDKSVENTPDLIDQWIKEKNVKCTFIKNTENIGITRVSNKIVGLSKGKYISLFAIDDIMLPRKIELQVKLLEEAGEEYGLCYANVERMDEDGQPLGLYVPKNEFVAQEGYILKSFVTDELSFSTPGCLIRTSVYKKAGMYDERVLYEDYNFFLRVFALFKAKYCDYPCLIYRTRSTSPIYEEWTKNNRERYHRDRVLSNLQALKFINDKDVREYLMKKNSQYLKSLSMHKSGYVKELIFTLLKNGYWNIPLRVWVRFITGK
jgi:glycosyltransferase involved in cell wall biosynthesis